MKGDLTGFIVYVSAMLGIIFVVAFVAQKTFLFTPGKRNPRFLNIESSLNLEPRKNLYVIRAGYERFLIASGTEGCQFMAKIENDNIPECAYPKEPEVVEAPDLTVIKKAINKIKPEIPIGNYGGNRKWN